MALSLVVVTLLLSIVAVRSDTITSSTSCYHLPDDNKCDTCMSNAETWNMDKCYNQGSFSRKLTCSAGGEIKITNYNQQNCTGIPTEIAAKEGCSVSVERYAKLTATGASIECTKDDCSNCRVNFLFNNSTSDDACSPADKGNSYKAKWSDDSVEFQYWKAQNCSGDLFLKGTFKKDQCTKVASYEQYSCMFTTTTTTSTGSVAVGSLMAVVMLLVALVTY